MSSRTYFECDCGDAEEWRPIAGLDGWYEVSDHGRVRSGKSRRGTTVGQIVKAFPHPLTGHMQLTTNLFGVKRRFSIHRLVAIEFLGNPGEGFEVCHNDGDSTNNHLPNLRWDTHRNNMRDAMEHGTFRFPTPPPIKTHCKHGHEYTPGNTGRNKHGGKYCITCSRMRARAQHARRVAARVAGT